MLHVSPQGGFHLKRTLLLVALWLLVPGTVHAGSQEDPELTDAAEDCAFAAGNEYADVVAAWVSDETPTSLNVNLALNRWQDGLAHAVGYTVQFRHQGVQFGVTGFYDATQGWFYGNAIVNEDGVGNYSDSTGSFAPGEPAVLTVLFDKSHFPHKDATDNQLVDITAGTADLKDQYPLFFFPVESPAYPPYVVCDEATAERTYTFQVGDHATHVMDEEPEDDAVEADDADEGSDAGASPDSTPAGPTNSPAEERGTPLQAILALGALATVALTRRR